jgi:phytoene dehydrogenase-like protein
MEQKVWRATRDRLESPSSDRFTPRERVPGIYWGGGWAHPSAGLGAVE